MSQVVEPARTWMLGESSNVGAVGLSVTDANVAKNGFVRLNVSFGAAGGTANTTGRPEGGRGLVTDVHFDGYNIAFVDGHVKWIKNGTGDQWVWRDPANP
jgi:prepilin-type processing-associated H-X9-DG protein